MTLLELYPKRSARWIAEKAAVSPDLVDRLTKQVPFSGTSHQRGDTPTSPPLLDVEQEERNAAVQKLWLQFKTQNEIADAVGMPQPTVNAILSAIRKYEIPITPGIFAEDMPPDSAPHALKAVPTEKGGRGKKGGLSAYAKLLGYKSHSTIMAYRSAAEIITETRLPADSFLEIDEQTNKVIGSKVKYLLAIHRADRSYWPVLCGHVQPASSRTFTRPDDIRATKPPKRVTGDSVRPGS